MVQQIKDPALLQLQVRLDPWPRELPFLRVWPRKKKKKEKKQGLVRMWRKRKPLLNAGGGVHWWRSMEVPQKSKKRTALWPGSVTPGHFPKGNGLRVSKRHLHPHGLATG